MAVFGFSLSTHELAELKEIDRGFCFLVVDFGLASVFFFSAPKNIVAHFYLGLQAAQLFQRVILGCV